MPILKIEQPKIVILPKKRWKLPIQDLIETCECYHLDTGHRLLEGRCYYERCECEKFVPIEFSISVEITEWDIFESENPDHSERDSLNWWSELESWRKLNAN